MVTVSMNLEGFFGINFAFRIFHYYFPAFQHIVLDQCHLFPEGHATLTAGRSVGLAVALSFRKKHKPCCSNIVWNEIRPGTGAVSHTGDPLAL